MTTIEKEAGLYANGTSLERARGPFSCGFVSGRALCADGVVRSVKFQNGGVASTFFSIPASVKVKGMTVSGYVTVETVNGFSVATDDDPEIVRFVAHTYGKNGHLLK